MVYTFLRSSGVRQTGQNIMLYLSNVPDVEVGVEVSGPFDDAVNVVPSELPAGSVAVMVHRGPYAGLVQAHDTVREWCRAHGMATTGVRWEIYGDWREDASELETEVCYQLA